jgi:hypothetical protein
MTMVRQATAAAAALILFSTGAAAPAAAAEPATAPTASESSDWTAWLGCWRPTGEDAPAAALVCITPGDTPSSIRIVSFDEGEMVAESIVHADGQPRPVSDGGCTGTETASWSQDGRRVFTRTDLDCSGVRRVSTGVIAMVSEVEWIDAQAITVADQHAARAVRYRSVRAAAVPPAAAHLVPEQQLVGEAARLNASRPLDFDAVVEASAVVAEPALEALLAAHQHGFGLNARTLVELERRGVPASVIDMMVALSHPRTFAVQAPSARAGFPVERDRAGRVLAERCMDDWNAAARTRECDRYYGQRYSPFGYYNRYGYNYGYGYSPFGYDPYGWHYGRGPIVVIVRPEDSGTRGSGGEVIPGRGYTRGNAEPTGRRAEPRQGSGASQPSSSGANSTSAGSSSSSEPSTPRQAVPRPSGNDPESR